MTEKKTDDILEKEEGKKRNLIGKSAILFTVVAVLMSLFHLYSSGVQMLPQMQHRAIHLALALALTFMLYSSGKSSSGKIPWYDWTLVIAALGIGAYLVIFNGEMVMRAGEPITLDLVLGGITILMILEATRRTMGWPLVIVAVSALGYALLGHLIPGEFGHRYYDLSRVIEHMFLTGEGIYGVAIYVTATFVFIFILLGSFLTETGGAQAFIDMAFSVAGRYRGGPAKAAIIGSGLMGTISGSSFANVAGTGTFTIPLMKSVGYKPEFAGGVEAAASAGGQIMPPIMGAAAFIMAEMTGIPYGKLILHAAIPAVLYYMSVFIMVDMEAAKMGLKGLSSDELPRMKDVFKKGGFLLLAPLSIIVMLLMGYSPIKASFSAVVLVIVISFFQKETRLSVQSTIRALENGARSALGVIAACAVAGLIVGSVTLTGVGLKFADLIISLANGNLIPALALTMVACIVMGMGMPTTALYIILGSMIAPALVKMGVPVVAAHLFIFYYGCMAAVTPPVALSSYLAATIAKADSIKTAFCGLQLSLSAFVLPFIFVLSPALLLLDSTLGSTIQIIVTAFGGIIALSAALEGYFRGSLRIWQRAGMAVSSILMIIPSLQSDLIGLAIFAGVYAAQITFYKAQEQVG